MMAFRLLDASTIRLLLWYVSCSLVVFILLVYGTDYLFTHVPVDPEAYDSFCSVPYSLIILLCDAQNIFLIL